LTPKLPHPHHLKQIILIKPPKKTNLTLSFQTFLPPPTKKHHLYNLPPKKLPYLYPYTPPITQRTKVTYHQLYLTLKPTNPSI
ncbi:YfkD family protein, partial [Priestia megaterium]|uniref:YfkD family protein n=1 Tax=Priestia megaterium TaxID=1404 RepID=UPI0039A21F27